MINNTITFSYITNKCLPEQVTLTSEQHCPGLQSGTATSVHCSASVHPPLSIAHEYLQYRSPVASQIVQFDPGGHGCNIQAMKYNYAKHNKYSMYANVNATNYKINFRIYTSSYIDMKPVIVRMSIVTCQAIKHASLTTAKCYSNIFS